MNTYLFKLWIGGSLIFYCVPAISMDDNYFSNHEIGWHWYKDPKKTEVEDISVVDPNLEMNAVHAAVKRALNKAVLYPTKENVKTYITLQNELTKHANQFNHTWQAILLENPELNYSILHPTNNLAKQVEYDQKHSLEEKTLHGLAKNNQIYFFYKSICLYCQRFAPIVKDFSTTYGFEVLPITTDGISLPEFPDSYNDQGESSIYHVTVEPTLFLVNPTTHKAIRIATGLTSQSEIKNNIMALVTHFDGDVL